MVRVFTLSAVDCGFKPRSGHTIELVFVASPLSIKKKEQRLVVSLDQDNVSE
jgi:hypothetical protein